MERLQGAAGRCMVEGMTPNRPPGRMPRTARFWYRWFKPAA
jgi:hypothetical protein